MDLKSVRSPFCRLSRKENILSAFFASLRWACPFHSPLFSFVVYGYRHGCMVLWARTMPRALE